MKGLQFVKGAAVFLATAGLTLPQRPMADGNQSPARPVAKAPRAVAIPDITMSADGKVTGRVVDHTGKPLEGAQVTLRQEKKDIATTVTNKDGVYSFANARTGVYNIGSGNTEGVFRVWSEKTAPPSAKGHALLVMGENGARGQFGAVDPTLVLLTAGVIAAVVLSAIILDKENKENQTPQSP
jgi:hypothetical protein